ncbi:Hsp20 family protein [Faunimonas sp. B44]|uniref:Hsp20 family protein n=1 Tax=Faunimonas sp. B44 TaxID=3461493 RepID=UPI0040450198
MTRMTPFSSPFLVGFDDVERLFDRVSKSGSDGYPPYNVERIPATEGASARLVITLAVAGFGTEDIDITLEENELVIRGRQAEESERDYLHRGIAARQFQRTFVLADGMDVVGADLKDGLLAIELVRPDPERSARKIRIASRD